MRVVDGSLAEAFPRMRNLGPLAADDGHSRRTDADHEIESGPATWHRVVRRKPGRNQLTILAARGWPTRRFAANRELPVAMYEQIQFESASGLNEVIQFLEWESASDSNTPERDWRRPIRCGTPI
jgi:hypothetical protein